LPQNLPLFTVSQIFRTARPVKKDRFSMPVPSLGVRPVPPAIWRKKGPSPQMPLLFPQNEQSWKGRISRTGRKAAAMGSQIGHGLFPLFPLLPFVLSFAKGARTGTRTRRKGTKGGRTTQIRPKYCIPARSVLH